MFNNLPKEARQRLDREQNIWIASVRPDGRPHLAPVWFVFFEDRLYIGTDQRSVKSSNMLQNPKVALALEGGDHPVICEGVARFLSQPYPEALLGVFMQKYEWDITTDDRYNQVIEISPQKWLTW